MIKPAWPIAATLLLTGVVGLVVVRPSHDSGGTAAESPKIEQTPPTQPPPHDDEPEVAHFIYLFDVSRSVNTGRGTDNPLLRATRLLQPTIAAVRRSEIWEPNRHTVATIGSASLGQEDICTILYPARTIFISSDTVALAKTLSECIISIEGQKAEDNTDLTGAFTYAAQRIGTQRPTFKALFAFSDFDEDPGRGMTQAVPDLHGTCVILVLIVTPGIAVRPHLIDERQKLWRQKALEWHAKAVLLKTTIGFDGEDVIQFLRTCERRS